MTSKTLSEEFATKTVEIRGTTYEFRELSAAEYEEIVKLTAGEDDTAPLDTVLRLMAAKSITNIKLSPQDLSAKPYSIYAKILSTVNTLHFSPLPEEKNGDAPNA